MIKFLILIVAFLFTVGCAPPSAPREPVDKDLAQSIKSGSRLVDAEAKLGPAGTPTAEQLESLENVFAKMRESTRANARADLKVSWGNEKAYLVVVVNDEGTIWVTSNHFGDKRRPPRPSRDPRQTE